MELLAFVSFIDDEFDYTIVKTSDTKFETIRNLCIKFIKYIDKL